MIILYPLYWAFMSEVSEKETVLHPNLILNLVSNSGALLTIH